MGCAKPSQGLGAYIFDAVVEVDVGCCSGEAKLELVRGAPLPEPRKKRRVRVGLSRGQMRDTQAFNPDLSAYLRVWPSSFAGNAWSM